MKILVSSVTNARREILASHLKTVLWQALPKGVEVEYLYVVDPTAPKETKEALQDASIPFVTGDPKPADALYGVDEITHRWNKVTFGWLARQKQKLLEYAQEHGYDAIFLCDSDLLLAPDTLFHLLESGKSVVSAVFWTRWQPDAPPLPQVWATHPYNFHGMGYEAHEFLDALAGRALLRCGGLGACTLIRDSAIPRVGFWPPVEGLPEGGMWQGEDRHFCVRAARNRVELWADAWADIFHVYRPEDIAKIDHWLSRLSHDHINVVTPQIGDNVSLTLEPCEEPALLGFRRQLRGRLGTIRLLPDVERTILEMRVGDERFTRVRFPSWYPLAPYRGQSRILRIRLLGAKPFSFAPTLADSTFPADGLLTFDPYYFEGPPNPTFERDPEPEPSVP